MMKMLFRSLSPALLWGSLVLSLSACGDSPWNNPHAPDEEGKLIYQSVMSPAPPKHLDPAISYATDESLIIMQIYEPPLGYHFLKRPYELLPLALESMPIVTYLGEDGQSLEEGDDSVAFSRYTLRLRDTAHAEDLLQTVFENGRRSAPSPLIGDVRAHALAQIASLPEESKRLRNPEIYRVVLSSRVGGLKDEMLSLRNNG